MRNIVKKELWRTPDVLGFAAHWTWIECVFWSMLFYDSAFQLDIDAFETTQTLESLWVVSLFANVATIAALLALAHRRNPLADIAWLPAAASALTCCGTLLLSHAVGAAVGPAAPTAYLAGCALTGVGSAIVVVLWGETLTSLGSRRVVHYSVAALLIAVVAYVFIRMLPVDFAQVLVAFLPVASMTLLSRLKRSLPRVASKNRNVRVTERPPMLMVLIAFFFGFSFGAMKGMISPTGAEWIEARDMLNVAAIAVGAIAIYVTTEIYRMDFDHLTYQVALPFMALGFLFLPLHEPFSVLGTAVHQFGYQYFYIVLWAIWPVLATRGNVPAGWVTGWGMLAIQLGQLVGSVTGGNMIEYVQGDLGRAMLSSVIVFAILLVALFAFGNRSASTAWGFVKPMEEKSSLSELESAGMRLARRHHLSPRETEVFFLLAKGRNRAFIRDELVIGDETVKSHIKSVYRKIDVHSQQELIGVVEQECGKAAVK